MKHATFLTLLFCFFFYKANSQELEETLYRQLNELSEEEEINEDENIEILSQHKLDINTASAEDWSVFPFITELQITSLENYKKLFGRLISVYELQAVPLWSIDLLEKIAPFLSVNNETPLTGKNILSGEHFFRIRNSRVIEKQKGYSTKAYAGSPDHLTVNYRYRSMNFLEAGFVAEKDPGEPIGFSKPLIDFTSFYLQLKRKGLIRTFIIGDFTASLGQGLIQWQSRSIRKSTLVTSIKRPPVIFRPHSSAGETNFHRGVAVTIVKHHLSLSLFSSCQQVSAGMDDSSEKINSINASGLHRTNSEINNRNNTRQFAAGGNFSFTKKELSVGINAVLYQFSKPLAAGPELYQLNNITQRQWINAGIDYSLTKGNKHFFGELAFDRKRAGAFVTGMLAAIDPKADLSLLIRKIDPHYRSIAGNAFTESTEPANETGVYLGLTIRPVTTIQIDGYFDFFSFPWLRYRIDRPSNGHEYLLLFTWKPSKQWELSARFRLKEKEQNRDFEEVTDRIVATIKQSARVQLQRQISRSLSFRSGFESCRFRYVDEKTYGFAAYAEAGLKINRWISGNSRFMVFKTDNFDTRIYNYESDLPFSGSIPFVMGEGWRYYFNIRVKPTGKYSLAFRFARTIYAEKQAVGSGNEEIFFPHKTEVRMQVQRSF